MVCSANHYACDTVGLGHVQIVQRRGRPPAFDTEHYRQRNVIERCVGWLKEACAVATRHEKFAVHYLSAFKLAMIRQYVRLALSDKP